MTIRYLINDKVINEVILATEEELAKYLPVLFPDATPKFREFVLNRIVDSPRYPYRNSYVEISRHNYNPKEKQVWKNVNVPHNKAPKAADHINLNHYIVFNKNNRKSESFTNLAALCRAMNLDYTFTHKMINSAESFVLGKYIFTKTQMNLNEYYKNKVQELV